jgi:hypothetical protein
MFLTIQIYLNVIVIKLIILAIAYLNLMANIIKYISKTATHSILQLHYHHPNNWQATYAGGNTHNIEIAHFFVSQLVIVLTINNLTTNKKHNEIIVKDQTTSNTFNKLHTAVHCMTYT